jgi:prepilin-type N-terminal cleavage/methylation domain-containing protein
MSTQRGFTLAEILVVLAVVAGLVLGGAYFANNTLTQGKRDSAIAQQALAMAELTQAAKTYATETGHAWPDGQREITVSELIAVGRLPANWQSRFGAVGATPLGQRYVASVIKGGPATAKIYRLLVSESGDVTRGHAGRAGLSISQTDALRAHKAAIADRLQRQHDLHAGTTGAPPSSVGLVGGGTQIGIGDQVTTPPVAAVAVAILEGYPELSRDATAAGCPGGDCNAAPTAYSACQVQPPSGGLNGTTATCPSGMDEVARWPHCRLLFTDAPDPIVATPVGPLTFSTVLPVSPSSMAACSGGCNQASFAQCGYKDKDGDVPQGLCSGGLKDWGRLNITGNRTNGFVYRWVVQAQFFTQANQRQHQGITLNNGALPGSNYLCNTTAASTSGGYFHITNSQALRTGATTAAQDLLCCTPR